MQKRIIKIVMNGVTGRMGRTQHLVRSILAIRHQGGIPLRNGETLWPEPILVGRDERRLRSLAEEYGLTVWTTDLNQALSDPDTEIYFDAQVTSENGCGETRFSYFVSGHRFTGCGESMVYLILGGAAIDS